MSFPFLVTKILWVFPLVLQSAIAFSMLRRRLVTSFPVFFGYTVLVLSADTALLFLNTSTNLYALVYWCEEALAVLLSLGVIFEILLHIFAAYPSLRFVLNSVSALGTVFAVAALLMLILAEGDRGANRAFEFVILAERSARFLQACLLIVVIALMSRLGLKWHNVSVGIAAGFGTYSALALAGWELRAHLHVVSHATFVLLNSAAYNVAAIIWAFYILLPPQAIRVEYLPKFNLAEWNNAVSAYIIQWYRRY
jgi:hypothetical protein